MSALLAILDDVKYRNQKSIPHGGWDIRIRVYCGEDFSEIYYGTESVYFLVDGKGYFFVPKDSESQLEYDNFYKELKDLLTHNE